MSILHALNNFSPESIDNDWIENVATEVHGSEVEQYLLKIAEGSVSSTSHTERKLAAILRAVLLILKTDGEE